MKNKTLKDKSCGRDIIDLIFLIKFVERMVGCVFDVRSQKMKNKTLNDKKIKVINAGKELIDLVIRLTKKECEDMFLNYEEVEEIREGERQECKDEFRKKIDEAKFLTKMMKFMIKDKIIGDLK